MKIIHIKLTDDDHLNLKITALGDKLTMQSFVENLIKKNTEITAPPAYTKKEYEEHLAEQAEKDGPVIFLNCKHPIKGFGCSSRTCPNYGG